MNTENFLEDSDSSDEDYVPDGKEEAVSELDSDGELIETLDGRDSEKTWDKGKTRKRTKRVTHVRKKVRKNQEKQQEEEVLETPENPKLDSAKKESEEDLWADFIKDTGFRSKSNKYEPPRKPIENMPNYSDKDKPGLQEKSVVAEKSNAKVKITQIFEFAGEEVKIEKEVDKNSAEAKLLVKEPPKSTRPSKTGGLSGIGNVLSQLGKKQKISTLEKSKLDWDRFKKEENIEEELQTHNKGKDGYLDRQDFLQRADLRRFEIERDIRNTERAKRFNSTL
ncbi:craniofacial development protein 1 [Cylas formicarius]|uniref:craniofacial development protein 1 n=1 Tax=Cylas formicarius TaxID=197179 RepID=UPI002958D091|nr:craniofacial development protein 1 [Cylas formicarius]